MKPSELFGVIVRCGGLALVCYSIFRFVPLVLIQFAASGNRNLLLLLAVPLISFFLGLWLLRSADAIVRFAYPQDAD